MKGLLNFLIILFFSCCNFVSAESIDINTASLKELDLLSGIGPKYAQGIIDNRPYSSVDELTRVKGIGEKTLQKIKEQGLACVNCVTVLNTNETKRTDEATTLENPDEVRPNTVYPEGIIFSEILPSPAGPDDIEEFFELQNTNNFEVDLREWLVKDNIGTTTTFTIPPNTKILSNSFLVFKRPETKIMLNNDEDGLILFSPDNKIIDSVSFSKAPTGQSYNKISTGWAWSKTITPGAVNIITSIVAKNTSSKILPKNEKSDKKIVEVKDLMASLPKNNNSSNPWPLFFIVLGATIILAFIVVFIKIRFKN